MMQISKGRPFGRRGMIFENLITILDGGPLNRCYMTYMAVGVFFICSVCLKSTLPETMKDVHR